MAITFGPKPENPAFFSNQVQGLVNRTGDLQHRVESLEYKYKQIFECLTETLGRIRSLEQHYLWLEGTGPSAKKMRCKMTPKPSKPSSKGKKQ